jgi:hypothetical protein
MQRGGKRPGAGRPKGKQNRSTEAMKATLEDLARRHTPVAINALVTIAERGESEAARVSAATAILDRGYGRPKQQIEASVTTEVAERLDAARKRALARKG